MLVACLCTALGLVRPAAAPAAEATKPAGSGSAWNAVLAPQPSFAPYVIAVDKSRQEVAIVTDSPDQPFIRFVGTTGRVGGDKQKRGDLKTPEGVYFVVRHIASGLDFFKYGKEAFTLNYPNPVDRLRRKTGSGIWIHGRGEPLSPMQTEGCVSMINDELADIGNLLVPGTPVLMAASVAFDAQNASEQANEIALLTERVTAWAEAWAQRSDDFFDFYNQKAYAIAQNTDFRTFMAQKKRVFARQEWIRVTVDGLRILPGPGYYVTCFSQTYASPGHTDSGIRRLYWAKDDSGIYTIIGMEWLPGAKAQTPPVSLATEKPLTWDELAPGLPLDVSAQYPPPMP